MLFYPFEAATISNGNNSESPFLSNCQFISNLAIHETKTGKVEVATSLLTYAF